MHETFRLGRVAGVAVGLHWSVLAIVALVAWSLAVGTLPGVVPDQAVGWYWLGGVVGAIALLASILAHEVMHAVVAVRHGVRVEGITLWMFGGMARLASHAADPTAELRIALAGPLTSLAVGTLSVVVAGLAEWVGAPRLLVAGLVWFGIVNVVLAVFNLLPGAPLDGGRVLGALLWRHTGDELSSRVRAARAGRLVGQWLIALGVLEVLLGAGLGGLWLAWIGWFLTAAARAEEADATNRWLLAEVRVRDVMTPSPVMVPADEDVDTFVHTQALGMRGSTYPVVDGLGRPAGLVTLRQIRTVPRAAWRGTRLGTLAVPMERVQVARPDELLLDALHATGESEGRILVMEGDQVVGLVSPSDVQRALERHALLRDRSTVGGRSTT